MTRGVASQGSSLGWCGPNSPGLRPEGGTWCGAAPLRATAPAISVPGTGRSWVPPQSSPSGGVNRYLASGSTSRWSPALSQKEDSTPLGARSVASIRRSSRSGMDRGRRFGMLKSRRSIRLPPQGVRLSCTQSATSSLRGASGRRTQRDRSSRCEGLLQLGETSYALRRSPAQQTSARNSRTWQPRQSRDRVSSLAM